MSEETLINDDVVDDPTPEDITPTDEHAWFWAEGQQGEGDAPDWYKGDKYKSVADQAAAYPELEKRLGGMKGAPEEYGLDLPEGFELPEGVEATISKDDPLVEAFSKVAKENNVSQELFTQMMGLYVGQQANDYQAAQESTQSQIEQLGENAQSRLNEIAKWGKANMDDEMFNSFKNALTTADSVKAVEFLIGKTRNNQMPDPSNINPALKSSMVIELEELRSAKDENGQLKWMTDPVHRQKINALQNELGSKGEYRQVMG